MSAEQECFCPQVSGRIMRTWFIKPCLLKKNGDYLNFGNSSGGTLFSYYYHLNHDIAFGAMMAFTTRTSSISGRYKELLYSNPELYWNPKEQEYVEYYRTEYTYRTWNKGSIKSKSFFFLPSMKWSYLNNSWCSLYMKVSIGMHYQQYIVDTGGRPNSTGNDLDKNYLRFAYLLTPFGWGVGKQKVRGFLEIGFGSNTNLQIGLTYRFGRYPRRI